MSRQFYHQLISHHQKYNSQLNMLTKRKELNTEILIIRIYYTQNLIFNLNFQCISKYFFLYIV